MSLDQFGVTPKAQISRPNQAGFWNIAVAEEDTELWGRRWDAVIPAGVLKKFTGQGSVSIPITNTAFVTPAGNDLTGVIGQFEFPFATIQAASAAAELTFGKVVVYPGDYNITSSNWVRNNVTYFFHPGANVIRSGFGGNCITDSGIANFNVKIYGYGNFSSISASGVSLSDNNSVLYLECNSIVGNQSGIVATGGSQLIVRCREDIYTTGNTFYALRAGGNVAFDVECRNLINPAGNFNPTVYIRNHSTDGTQRTCYVKCKRIISSANGNFAAVRFENSGNCTLYLESDITHTIGFPQSFVGGIFALDGGNLQYSGNAFSSDGKGMTFLTVSKAVGTINFFLTKPGSSVSSFLTTCDYNDITGYAVNLSTQLQRNDVTAGNTVNIGRLLYFGATAGGNAHFYDCEILNRCTAVGGTPVSLDGAQVSAFRNCVVWIDSAIFNNSFVGITPQDIKLYGNSMSNAPINPNITEKVSTLIVDALVTPIV